LALCAEHLTARVCQGVHATRFRTATPVKPAMSLVVANRRREIIKALFGEAGVAIPQPHRVISKK